MSTLAERLQTLLESTGTSKTELAKAVGVKQPSINDLCSGKSQGMRAATAIKIADFFKVNYLWLVTGEGPKALANVEDGPGIKQFVPLISWVQAGTFTGIEWPDDAELYPTPRHMSDGSYALRVRGESMLPKFAEGDIIFVDPSREVLSNSYVIAVTGNNETTFKQYISDGELQYLRPLNKDWPGPAVIPITSDTHIIGVVIGKWTDY